MSAKLLFQDGDLRYKREKYNTKDINGSIYIVPDTNYENKPYDPWNVHDLLEDFLKTLDLVEVVAEDEYALGEALLGFVNKYGMFGIYWDYAASFNKVMENFKNSGSNIYPEFCFSSQIVAVSTVNYKKNTYSESSTVSIIKPGTVMNYEYYAKYFFPMISAPYPQPDPSKDNRNFLYDNYCEKVWLILESPHFDSMRNHYRNWKKGELKNYRTAIDCQIEYENGSFKWKPRTLLEMLSIIYTLNLSNNLDKKLKPCKCGCGKLLSINPNPNLEKEQKYYNEVCRKRTQDKVYSRIVKNNKIKHEYNNFYQKMYQRKRDYKITEKRFDSFIEKARQLKLMAEQEKITAEKFIDELKSLG